MRHDLLRHALRHTLLEVVAGVNLAVVAEMSSLADLALVAAADVVAHHETAAGLAKLRALLQPAASAACICLVLRCMLLGRPAASD